MDMTPSKWNAAATALAECRRVDEVKTWADKAAALKEYARQANDHALEVDAAEIRIRAERRLGQLLAQQKAEHGFHPGGNPNLPTPAKSEGVDPEPEPIKLKDAGIDYKLSSRAQKLAAVPEAEFEEALGDWRAETEEARGRVVARLESAGEARLGVCGPKDVPREIEASTPQESDLAQLVQELTAQVEALQQDNESMARVFETTDQVGAAMKEAARFRELARVLDARVKGLQSQLHEAQKSANHWKKKYEKEAKR